MGKEKVTVFLGRFKNHEELHEYVQLVYDEEGDATCALFRETGIEWFDEDSLEAFLFDEKDPYKRIMEASFADTFKPSLKEQLTPSLLSKYNAIILFYTANHTEPVMEGAKVVRAGVFDYEPDYS